MRLFFDTSALGKQFVEETDSGQVGAWLDEASELVLSVLVFPELVSLLNRSRRERRISDPQYAELMRRVRLTVSAATIVQITGAVVATTVRCLELTPLRASDAIHVASAIEARVDRFVSADRRQCRAAEVMGLPVEPVGQAREQRP